MINDENIEYQDNQEVHLMNLLGSVLDLDEKDKVIIINLLATDLNLKPLKTVAKEQDKSYNGLKQYGEPVIICGKYFGISKIKDNNLPF